MQLTRITFEKGNRKVVLQGMIHIGPESMYQQIQKEMDYLVYHTYRVFMEGIRPAQKEPATSKQKKIRQFMREVLRLMPNFAESLGVKSQKDSIKYPKSSKSADITADELYEQLEKSGFEPDPKVLKMGEDESVKESIGTLLTFIGPKNFFKFMHLMSEFSFIFELINGGSFNAVVLTYRNQHCFQVVESASEPLIYIHYGEGHISGLRELFTKAGWKVTETKHINVLDHL